MLIGLHGRAGSGKDTAYEFIAAWAQAKGLTPRREAFADRLKISAARALGYSGTAPLAFCNSLKRPGVYVEVIDYDYPESNVRLAISGRQYLQFYGTEAHRDVFGHDFWIDMVMATYLGDQEILVVTDVRFPDEADAIHVHGGTMWLIDRLQAEVGDRHSSEQPLPSELIDSTIPNHGPVNLLRETVEAAMENLIHDRAPSPSR